MQSKRKNGSLAARIVHIPTFLSLLFGWFLYMFCRKAYSSTMPHLTYEMGFSKDQLGTIASSFSMAYMVSKFFGAILSDHFDLGTLFSVGLFLSGVFTFIFPLGSTMILYCSLVIFLQGISQGAGWPAVAKILKVRFPPEQVGLYWSLVSCAGSIGASISPVLVATVTRHLMQWYTVYYTIGGVSIMASVVIYIMIPRPPLVQTQSKESGRSTKDVSYMDLFLNGDLWLATWIYFILYILKNALCDWGQLYFIQQLGYNQANAAFCIGMILFGGSIGSIVFGYLSDYLIRKLPCDSYLPRSPSLFLSCGLFTVFLYIFTVYSTSEFGTDVLCFCLGFSIDGTVAVIGLIAMDTAPDHMTGLAHGIACAWAQVGTLIAGWPFSVLVVKYNWMTSFTVLEVLSVIVTGLAGYLTYKTFSRTKKKQ